MEIVGWGGGRSELASVSFRDKNVRPWLGPEPLFSMYDHIIRVRL